MNKEQRLLELAKKRQENIYEGYSSIGDYDNGVWECDYVSPYSLSAHNVNADVLIILQDWCSADSFTGEICFQTLKLGHTPSVRTNINLKKLLDEHFDLSLEDTYATNLFPYVKKGQMNARIPAGDLLKAANDFTLPIINIIRPKLVICLGKNSFNALRKSCGLRSVSNMNEAVNANFKYLESTIFCQAHTGQLGQNNRNKGGVNRVVSDWELMKSAIGV